MSPGRSAPGMGAALALLLSVGAAVSDQGNQILHGEVLLGTGYLDGASDRYGKYSGLRSDGWKALLELDLEGRPQDSDRTDRWRVIGERTSFSSRYLQGSWIDQGSHRFTLTWQQTPRNLFADGLTPFRSSPGGQLGLPADWTATGASTAEMPQLDASLVPFRQRQERSTLQLDYRLQFADHWQLDLNLGREWRDGHHELAGMIGTTGGNARAALLPVPVDYETDTVELTLQRQGERHLLGVGYYGSFFTNHDRALGWDNPFGAQAQWQAAAGFPDGQGQLALVPDNRFQQLRVFGHARLGGATQASADLALGRMQQDDDFLPYTVNPALAPTVPLPVASLDGRVDTTNAHLRVSHRASPALQLNARLRYQDRNNRTDQHVYQAVPGDAGLQVGAEDGRINRPYSFTRRDLSLDARYRLPQRSRLQLGYEHRLRQRDFSEINSSREHIYRLGLQTARWQAATLRADLSHQRRNAGSYQGNRPLLSTRVPGSIAEDAFENHPLLRRYYLVDRDRDQLRLGLDLHPDPRWFASVGWSWSEDDYREDLFGLNSTRLQSWLFDAGYTPSDAVSWTAFLHRDRYRNRQSSRSFTAAPATVNDPNRDWNVRSGDRYDTWGLALDREGLALPAQLAELTGHQGSIDLRLEFSEARSRSDIDVTAGEALNVAALPDLSTRLRRLALELRYHATEQTQLRLAWDHERYRSSDFALDDVQVDSVAAVLLFGETSPRHTANWFTLALQHRF